MHAIALTKENLPKIVDIQMTSEQLRAIDVYLATPGGWFAVSGYVARNGELAESLVILPAYIFPTNFEYDPIKIKTDWDQIVRK